jgi:AraC-like DNA-binding protein
VPYELASLLRFRLLPWLVQNGAARFIVARPEMSTAQMPPDVRLRRRKIAGQRVIVRNRRYYNNARSVTALWPESDLNEVSTPKLACVLSGRVDYQLGHYAVQCGAGHFLFIPPGVPHPEGSRSYADPQKGATCELLFLAAHQNAIECWVSRWDEQGYKLAGKHLLLHGHATMLLQTVCEEIAADEEYSLLIGERLLSGFFQLMLREAEAGRIQPIRSHAPQWSASEEISSATPADFKTSLQRHIQTNLHKPLTLEGVARELLISRTQLIRLTRRETGQSFTEFLTARRLAEAMQLLQNSQWTINSISYFVGFKSPSYFRTVFRERTGQTPSQFRAHARRNGATEKMSDS